MKVEINDELVNNHKYSEAKTAAAGCDGRYKKKKRQRTPKRAVDDSGGKSSGVFYGVFERVSSTRLKLKAEYSQTFYAIAHMIADEHMQSRLALTPSNDSAVSQNESIRKFHRNAESALRMLADRLLKSFRMDVLVNAERYSMEQWREALSKFDASTRVEATISPVNNRHLKGT
jgi:hypothetical protein